MKPLKDLLESEGITLQPLFGVGEEQLRSEAETMISSAGADVPAGLDLVKQAHPVASCGVFILN